MGLRAVYLLLLVLLIASCTKEVQKKEIKQYVIADINTEVISEQYLKNYYYGMGMAIDEINASGGVNGIPLKLIKKNDYGTYIEAYAQAREAVENNNAIILTGTSKNNTMIGVARYAGENKVPFLSTGTPSELLITGSQASQWSFRVRAGYELQLQAITSEIANLKSIRNTVIISYSNEEGLALSKRIKEVMIAKNKDIKFSSDIYVAPNRPVNDSVILNIKNSFTTSVIIAVDGNDLMALMKELQKSKVVVGKTVFALQAGEPEWMSDLGKYAPISWVVTGFPWYSINTEENKKFFKKYTENYKITPQYGSYIGYITIYLAYGALSKADLYKNNPENRAKIVEKLQESQFRSPVGLIKMRKDNQTDISTYVGTLKLYNKNKNNKYPYQEVRMFDIKLIKADKYLQDLTATRATIIDDNFKPKKPKYKPKEEHNIKHQDNPYE